MKRNITIEINSADSKHGRVWATNEFRMSSVVSVPIKRNLCSWLSPEVLKKNDRYRKTM
jgi:hypothetical protein